MGLLYTTVKIESVPVFSDNQMCVLVECKCGNSEIDIYITTNISSSPCALMFNQSWFTDLMGFPHISGVCTMTNISTQLDGARLTASCFSHLHTRVSTGIKRVLLLYEIFTIF